MGIEGDFGLGIMNFSVLFFLQLPSMLHWISSEAKAASNEDM